MYFPDTPEAVPGSPLSNNQPPALLTIGMHSSRLHYLSPEAMTGGAACQESWEGNPVRHVMGGDLGLRG